MSWGLADKIGIILGYIAFLPLGYSAWILLTMERRRKNNLKRIRKEPGNRPVVLIVDLVKTLDIQADVENFIRATDELKDIKSEDIHRVQRTKDLSPDDVDSILEDIRKERYEIVCKGTDKIHLFFGGPSSIALMIGAEFSNGCSVICYQRNNDTKRYEVWGHI